MAAAVANWLFLTLTLIKSVSIPAFGKINFWLRFEEEYTKFDSKRTPSWISILSKDAIPSKTGTVISSKIENIKDWPENAPAVDATGPFFSVIVDGVGVVKVVSTKKLTLHHQIQRWILFLDKSSMESEFHSHLPSMLCFELSKFLEQTF